ncbi:MAG: thioesterase domain-containing protein, partial [Vicinamibacterales bacterium]
IELGEIETAIAQHPGVRATVVMAREDTPGDTRLVAYIVPETKDGPPEAPRDLPTDLKTFLRTTLPEYMVPGVCVLLEALPLTANGKIDRRALAPPDRSAASLTHARVAPRDALETQLAAIWARVLGIEAVGTDDNFFDLGGHSLLAVRLMSEIETALGQKIPLVSLFQGATIGALASILRRGVSSISWPTLVEIQPDGTRPPLFCVSRPDVNALGYRSLARHLGPDQPVYGLQAQHPVDLKGEYSQAVVEKLADEYLKAMRLVQPTGPYQLLGQCRGAHIAFEMARRLSAEGQQTALLAILDTWVMENTLTPFWYVTYSLKQLAARGRRHLADRVASRNGRGATAATAPEKDPLQVYFPGPGYTPKTHSGRVAVFRALQQPRYRIRDNALGWGTLAPGGVEVYIVPGTHSSVLSEPDVEGLAAELKKCLLVDRVTAPLPAAGLQSRALR